MFALPVPEFVHFASISLSSKLITMDRYSVYYHCPNCNLGLRTISHYTGMRNCSVCWMAMHSHKQVSKSNIFISVPIIKIPIRYFKHTKMERTIRMIFRLELLLTGKSRCQWKTSRKHYEQILPERLWIQMEQPTDYQWSEFGPKMCEMWNTKR